MRKLLIANRGEIAVRIMRTCRQLGITTVAVYSDADVHAPHTRFADEAVYIGAAAAKESYLNIERILAAAARTNADAIHPGYGFLSENAEFAEACATAGITFIGPSPQAIRQMGLKIAGRQIAADAGVPTVPGYNGEDQSNAALRDQMLGIGFPVLIKASAGGGGKGMRVVRAASEMDEAIDGARREAEKSFGDGSLLLEKYIEQARHVEIQILGDTHGNLVHLFERDCSLQRRHQKIIEESPSPAVNAELRERMGVAAVSIGRALHYTNAGTVEFILAPDGEFYFIEVNTRLQVEHPVTEMITGLDLVKLQIEIAEGKPLPLAQADLQTSGHAIEARLYAEDPNNDFLPATGTIHDWHCPVEMDGLRMDAGVEAGSIISINYDPMLAKLIAHGSTRDEAIRKLQYALQSLSIQGVTTNREFLLRLLGQEEFSTGKAHTGFIAEHLSELTKAEDIALDRASAIAAALYWQKSWQTSDALMTNLPPSYRNNPYRNPSLKLQLGKQEVMVSWRHIAGDQFEVTALDTTVQAQVISWDRLQSVNNDHHSRKSVLRLVIDGIQRNFRLTEIGDQLFVHSFLGSHTVTRLPRHPEVQAAAEQGSMTAPMPGLVAKILVAVGQPVKAGDPLLILEAMKMEQTMRAAVDGVVETIRVHEGEVVGPGAMLITLASPQS
ncbi:MAG TPA: acetyl-CoA carboxylase biotin carboxylase subunit [Blastocatellia bacterium]|nr:acetyl-CoA carboxylase biotin carboxylase subunit [Blastocatellia bacterium]